MVEETEEGMEGVDLVVEVKEVVKGEGMGVEPVGEMVAEVMVVVKEEERVEEMEVDLEAVD